MPWLPPLTPAPPLKTHTPRPARAHRCCCLSACCWPPGPRARCRAASERAPALLFSCPAGEGAPAPARAQRLTRRAAAAAAAAAEAAAAEAAAVAAAAAEAAAAEAAAAEAAAVAEAAAAEPAAVAEAAAAPAEAGEEKGRRRKRPRSDGRDTLCPAGL